MTCLVLGALAGRVVDVDVSPGRLAVGAVVGAGVSRAFLRSVLLFGLASEFYDEEKAKKAHLYQPSSA